MKKTLAILLSLLLVFCLVPAAVFAEAPTEEEELEQEYEVIGWYAYGEDEESDAGDLVKSVKLNGEEIGPFGSETSFIVKPEAELSVELALEDGYELGTLGGYFFIWMIGEGEAFIPAEGTKTKVIAPEEEYMDMNTVITLLFSVVSSEIPEDLGIIDSVTLTAPTIKAGDKITMVEHTVTYTDGSTRTYKEAEPQPEVTVPEGAPYEVDWDLYDGEKVYASYWMLKDEDGYYYPDEDFTFEYDTDYFIQVWIRATDAFSEEDLETYRLFCLNRPPEVTVKNGELVDFYVEPMYIRGAATRMTDNDFSPFLCALIKVSVPSPEPVPTGDMNVTPWVWTMILTLSAFLTAAYYEMADIRRFHKGN